jgi:hypothetical protein
MAATPPLSLDFKSEAVVWLNRRTVDSISRLKRDFIIFKYLEPFNDELTSICANYNGESNGELNKLNYCFK